MDILDTVLGSAAAPSFIFVHHPHHTPSSVRPTLPTHCLPVLLDTIEHNNARLLYTAIVHRLATRLGVVEDLDGEIATWDGFARRLRDLWSSRHMRTRPKGKRKAGEMLNGDTLVNGHSTSLKMTNQQLVVLVITKAERMRHVLGSGWAVITRIRELSGIPITTVLQSQTSWDDLRPTRGDATEPVHIYLPPFAKDEISGQLLSCSTHPLWPRFLDVLLASVGQLVPASPPRELFYLAEPLWKVYTSALPPHREQLLLNRPYADSEYPPPPLAVTVKLLTDLKHQLSLPLAAAIENLIPRSTGRHEFVQVFLLQASLDGGLPRAALRSVPKSPPMDLPLVARFLVVAAYCASYNPAKSDLRLFGRGLGADGRRKKGGGTRRPGYGRVRLGKVAQRLLGPKPFPLDRLMAIFSALYAEHADRPDHLAPTLEDEDSDDEPYPSAAQAAARAERRRARDLEREEAWDDEVHHLTMSVKTWALIPELEAQGLLRRMSPGERLDNVILRCEAEYETAKTFAKELRLILDDYIYEAPT